MSKNSGNHWNDIKCPFFHNDNNVSIVCEGLFEDSSIRHTFPNGTLKRQFQKDYCNGIHECEDCQIYQLANKKYEGG